MDSLNHLFSPDSTEFFAGLQWNIPLWRQADLANLTKARIGKKMAMDTVRMTRISVVERVNTALNELASSQAQLRQREIEINLRKLALEKATRQRELGLATEFDLLSKYKDLLTARLEWINAEAEVNMARTSLLAAQGALVPNQWEL